MPVELVIVGGGPIGLATARAAAARGARTLVMERRSEGAPSSCCTGLVSPRTLDQLQVSQACVLRRIRATRIHLPSGRLLRLQSDQVKAFAICRKTLEAELLHHARRAGADIRFDTEVISAAPGVVAARSASKEYQTATSLIIAADGPRSRVAEMFSLKHPPTFVAAAQVEIEHTPDNTDQVELFVGEHVAPGFFGWYVPAEEGVARVGLAVWPDRNPCGLLDRLLEIHFPHAQIRSRAAGLIPLSRAPQSAAVGILLVGDAAGHTKPLSGGGLYTGGTCARIAGEMAAQAVRSDALLAELATSYPQQCLDAIGREQAFGNSVRHQLTRLQDKDIEAAITVLQEGSFMQFLADRADIDYFHRLPDALASEPQLWATILRILPILGHTYG